MVFAEEDKKHTKRGLELGGFDGGFGGHDFGGHDFGGHEVKTITITKNVPVPVPHPVPVPVIKHVPVPYKVHINSIILSQFNHANIVTGSSKSTG